MENQTTNYRVVGFEEIEGGKIGVPLTVQVNQPMTRESFIEIMESRGFRHTGTNNNARQRAELQDQPTFDGLAGPMFDGDAIRYETWKAYDILSR